MDKSLEMPNVFRSHILQALIVALVCVVVPYVLFPNRVSRFTRGLFRRPAGATQTSGVGLQDRRGLRLALNVFIGTTLLWLLLWHGAGINPIWAITSMIAASEPVVKQAAVVFRARILNALLGCAVGLLFAIFGQTEWKLPLALSATVLLSTYVVRIQTMWLQAPITAAVMIASGITHHSRLAALQIGLQRVGEVLLGCLIGLAVTWMMSRLWPWPKGPEGGAVAETGGVPADQAQTQANKPRIEPKEQSAQDCAPAAEIGIYAVSSGCAARGFHLDARRIL